MAVSIAGVFWRAVRPSELAYRHTRTPESAIERICRRRRRPLLDILTAAAAASLGRVSEPARYSFSDRSARIRFSRQKQKALPQCCPFATWTP